MAISEIITYTGNALKLNASGIVPRNQSVGILKVRNEYSCTEIRAGFVISCFFHKKKRLMSIDITVIYKAIPKKTLGI